MMKMGKSCSYSPTPTLEHIFSEILSTPPTNQNSELKHETKYIYGTLIFNMLRCRKSIYGRSESLKLVRLSLLTKTKNDSFSPTAKLFLFVNWIVNVYMLCLENPHCVVLGSDSLLYLISTFLCFQNIAWLLEPFFFPLTLENVIRKMKIFSWRFFNKKKKAFLCSL